MPKDIIGTSRAKLNDLLGQRADLLAAAETAREKNDLLEAKSKLDAAKALNSQIDDLKALVDEADRYDISHAAKFGTSKKDLEEMGRSLMARERVSFDVSDVLKTIRTNSTLFTGELVTPTGGGSQINDGFNAQISELINQVRSENFEGLLAWEEPYMLTTQTASAGKPATVAGTARTASDPSFAKAKLTPMEVQTTSFVDRNIAHLSPTAYAAKCQTYALLALRRKVNELIINGDGQSSPDVFGITTAKNTKGNAIFASSTIEAINENTLHDLVFGFGGNEMVAGNARLILTKANLAALGNLRGTNEKQRLFEIAAQGNTGTIKDGGLVVPYTICKDIGDTKLAYGDPQAYLLGLFSNYSIRVDESVKSVERMIAILGDVLVGGNLTYDKAFTVTTIGG